MKKVDQTEAARTPNEIPDSSTRYVIATYCQNCKYHFDIIVDYTQGRRGSKPCRLSDKENPMHHLRLVKSWIKNRDGDPPDWSKYNMKIESHTFYCSASSCPATVVINISMPRLPPQMLPSILDQVTLRDRGARIIAEEPERFLGQTPLSPAQVFMNIRAYLMDAKLGSDGGPLKKIAKRNKKFCLAFADECDSLFEYMDFIQITEEQVPPVSRD